MTSFENSSMDESPWRDSCPCPEETIISRPYRLLSDSAPGDDDETTPLVVWEVVFTCCVLFFMLVALLSDRVGADSVMLMALTAFMASSIISVAEGTAGFANEGLLSVLVLFVVAHGISVTGALDWYMGKLLGRPNTIAGAQLRLMIPISIISAFLNNTPVVAVMIPIVQRWGKNIGVSPQQLLIPLSFASILGGTCTLIGTSTNLVVVGLLKDEYPNDPDIQIGLFDLSLYGVPVMLIGVAYVLAASPFLLPGARRKGGADILNDSEDVLLGARLTQWSPAAGRSVKRSGLRDTGGIFLVSVFRATTGNVHRAVGQDFVLNVGDILYFTGLVESFGEFCEEHGLEMITNETTDHVVDEKANLPDGNVAGNDVHASISEFQSNVSENLKSVAEEDHRRTSSLLGVEIGITAESLIESDETDRLRTINKLQDLIRGTPREPDSSPRTPRRKQATVGVRFNDPAQIVVTADNHEKHSLVVVGINAHDRPGLLLDISKGLLRLNLQLRHTEASVVDERSLSIWRCECIESHLPDLDEVWSVLNALLETEGGVEAVKKRGLRVIRAEVTKGSRLIGKTAAEMNFRQTYKAAIVAVQKEGQNVTMASAARFSAGDVLILQTRDNSPLLIDPPEDFYDRTSHNSTNPPSRNTSGINLVKLVKERFSSQDVKALDSTAGEKENRSGSHVASREDSEEEDFYIPGETMTKEPSPDDELDASELGNGSVILTLEHQKSAWKDLRVLSTNSNKTGDVGSHQREFLTAMSIAADSALAKKTVAQAGLTKLPGVTLVNIERPIERATEKDKKTRKMVLSAVTSANQSVSVAGSVDESSFLEVEQAFVTVSPDEPLQEGDVLWFSGSASAVGDLRKIPGLRSFDSDQVEKINEKVFDRRLVQAVVARKGPLVGKTIREMRFRTRYGAAVISVHREGQRIHDHPGQIKLHAGDVLLLEAGPTFIQRNAENDRSFALLSEVEGSAPPRLQKLIPAIVLVVGMLAAYTAGAASLLTCGLIASILMVAFGIMSEQEARTAVNWEVYITIACAFGIGTALVNSGVASAMADFMVNIGNAIGIGDAGLYGAVYLTTFLISNIVTNNAAAALVFPIAMDAADQTGADRLLMSYTLMLGASASFMSPFGYTTNLMIYGPGGYKFKDFLLIGSPMQVVLWIVSIVTVSISSTWWISWLISAAVLVAVAAVRLTNGKIGQKLSGSLRSGVPQTQTEEI